MGGGFLQDQKEKWIVCPECAKRQFPITQGTRIRDLVWKCKNCKKHFKINIDDRAFEPNN